MYTQRGSDHPRATSARNDRFLVLQSLRNRHQTTVELTKKLRNLLDKPPSAQTVTQRLVVYGFSVNRSGRVLRHTVQYSTNNDDLNLLGMKTG